jgi:2-polyprenyl-3-methyl-5-hydroxy-6-metoxy-1,4-benzoquinol methylase
MEQLIHVIKDNLKKGGSVLELGCGNGNLSNAIAQKLPDVGNIVAVDFYNQPEKLHSKVEFIKQDLEQFDIPGTFDLVILNQVLEHIINPLGLLLKIKKQLNHHGRILIVVPNRNGFGNEARVYLPEHGKHYFLWDVESLQFSLERLGFATRFYNRYTAASHGLLLRYIPMLLRIENPHITCVAMKDD